MKQYFGRHVLRAFVGLALAGGLMQAAPIVGSGVFNLSGAVYDTTTSLQFGYNSVPPPGDQKAAVVLPVAGQFSDLAPGSLAGIGNLFEPGHVPPGPVTPGTPFSLPNWVTLPDGINLDLTNIPLNTSVPLCSGTASDNTPGFVCRPFATSAVVLSQNVQGVSAQINLSGNAHFVGSTDNTPFVGLLSANFTFSPDNTISGLLADFNTHGFIMTGYSGNFSTTSAVPEPGYLAAVGFGLLAIGVWKKRKFAK